jgi:hypothetical protein
MLPRPHARSITGPGIRIERAPPAGFRCLLEEQPDAWVPRELRMAPAVKHGEWVVNSSLRFSESGELRGGDTAFSEAMSTSAPTAWVADPVTGLLAPFAVSESLAPILAQLEPGKPLARSVPEPLAVLLHSAGIVHDPGRADYERAQWRARLEAATRQFRDGYAALGCLLHPYTLAAARRYFRRLIRQRGARLGDGQSQQRWVAHNEPVARFFHHQLTQVVAAVAGVEIKPSYVYFACYEGGADLEWHTDREQCEISLSMLLDYSPRPEPESPWPLLLQTPHGRIAIHQRIGQVLAYRGREIPHARERLQAGHASMHLFLHYVPIQFAGELL